MSDWSSGYVVDVGYTHGFYKELAPSFLSYAALLQGIAAPGLGTEPLTYCELGCGQGFTTNLLAAANPHVQFYATDFNPSHIAGARDLARSAGLPNARFFEESFEESLANPDLPPFDIIALHGIYSWISDENRRAVVRLIREKLKPGGLAYVSYNAMPGWAPLLPLRQILRDYAKERTSGPTLKTVREAVAFAERLEAVQARYFKANPRAAHHLKDLKGRSPAYVAHEYLNGHFNAFYFGEVARELAEAKLTWVASATILDGVDAINLDDEQKKLLGDIGDPVLRQTMRDHMVNQQFRRDVFVKGPVPLSLSALREKRLDTRFTLTKAGSEVPRKVSAPLGDVVLQAEIYDPIVAALGAGPASIRQLLEDSALARLGERQLQQALTMLVGQGACHPCLPAAGETERLTSAAAFNEAISERTREGDDLAYFASGVTGGGMRIDRVSRLVWLARQRKAEDVPSFVWQALQRAGHRLSKEGSPLATHEDHMAAIGECVAVYDRAFVPAMTHLGIR